MQTQKSTSVLPLVMSNNNNTNILVLGAGELGIQVIRSLLGASKSSSTATATISVFLRRPNPDLEASGVSVILGDIAQNTVEELSAQFRHFHTIISCTGFVGGPGTQLKILEAVLQAKAHVKRYFPWQFGVDYDTIGRGSGQDLFNEQLDVRDRLRAQDEVEWVIVSTGMFTSFLFEPFFGLVEDDVVRALGSWDTKLTLTTAQDIGKMTAAIVFSEQPRFKNEVVFIAGETITYARLAEIVEEVKGKRMIRELWTLEKLRKDLEENPEDAIVKYRIVFALTRGIAWDMEKTFNHAKGIEMMDVKSWLVQK